MPQLTSRYPLVLTLRVDREIKDQLIALAYLKGLGGDMSKITRNILETVLPTTIANLTPEALEDFNKILENLKTERQLAAEALVEPEPEPELEPEPVSEGDDYEREPERPTEPQPE